MPESDPDVAGQLDDLHVLLTSELATEELSPSAAIELGLLARFFERLGDHAVNVTRRLAHIVELPVEAASKGA